MKEGFSYPVDARSTARDTSVHMTEPKEPAVEKPSPAEAPRGRFGRSGLRELESLQKHLEQVKALETEDREKKVTIAEKRIDLFMVEHDAAGAFKFKRFAREMLSTMDERSIERSSEGRLVFKGKEKESRLMFVNMGELDRFNKEGGSHSSGDKALIETVRAFEDDLIEAADVVAKNGGEMTYSIYRLAGNEYAVRVDGIDQEAFEGVLAKVRSSEPRVEGVEDPAPIVAEGFAMNEVMEILNDVEEQMPEPDRIGLEERNQITRFFMGIMLRRAEFSLDIDKFHKRVERVLQKIATGDLPAAKAFFDNYSAKAFKGAGADGEDLVFEDFVKMSGLEANERFVEEHRVGELAVKGAATHLVEDLALKGAAKNLHLETKSHDAKDTIASAVAAGRKRRNSIRPPVEVPSGTKIAEIPVSSIGHAVMLEKRKAYEEAVRDGLGEDEVAIALLEMQIEEARRDGSVTEGKFTGTGLLDRGSYYERLGQAFESKESKPCTTVFIDMGFLKYFDQRGGRDVGNDALRLAASLMERATELSGVKAEVFRYGGDEFTVIVDGGEAETDEYLKQLLKLRAQAGAVNSGALGGEKGYVPTELSFNYGVADTTMAEKAYGDLLELGLIPEGGDTANLKAELMTLIADKAIEGQKAADRIELLVLKMLEAKQNGDQAGLKHAEGLLAYSKKAIRGEIGGEAFIRDLVAGKDAPEDPVAHTRWLRERIGDWLAKNPEAKQENADQERHRVTGEVIEKYGLINTLNRRYREMVRLNHELADENHALLVQKRALEEELLQLRKARLNIV